MVNIVLLLTINFVAAVSHVEASVLCVTQSGVLTDTAVSCDKNITPQDLWNQDSSATAQNKVQIYFSSIEFGVNTASNVVDITNISTVILSGLDGLDSVTVINCSNSTGFHFSNVGNLKIEGIQFLACGSEHQYFLDVNSSQDFMAALYIENISGIVTVSNVTVNGTAGIGLVFANNSGSVSISNSTFTNNRGSGLGGGIFIEFTDTGDVTEYSFQNCSFTNNAAGFNHTLSLQDIKRNSLERGGGVKAYFRNTMSNVTINFANCWFKNNTAKHGGGMYLSFQISVQSVTVIVNNSHFEENRVHDAGGGFVAYYAVKSNEDQVNISFHSCNFAGNNGTEGGGVYFLSAPDQTGQKNSNQLDFSNCTWRENTALYGSAVLLSRSMTPNFFDDGSLPVPSFNNCSFIQNHICHKVRRLADNTSFTSFGRGALYSSSIKLQMAGNTSFIQNKGSAVFLFSSVLNIDPNSSVCFKGNHGYQGGAVYLSGFSSIILNTNTNIIFDSNTALNNGGAIFHLELIDPTTFLANKNCFIDYNESDSSICMNFTNNSVVMAPDHHSRGMSIFLTSIASCESIYKNWTKILVFDDKPGANYTKATYPYNFTVRETFPKQLIPGKEEVLDVFGIDDFQQEDTSQLHPFYLYSHPTDKNFTISPAYAIMVNNKIKVCGQPESKGFISMGVLGQYSAFRFDVELQECPPGYVYNTTTWVCECSVLNSSYYLGIAACDDALHQALLLPGYWAGYSGSGNFTEDSFRTAICHIGYCNVSHNKHMIYNKLPARAGDTSSVVCSGNRSGVLCGSCVQNMSAFFHTQDTFECGSEKYCHLGILFFLLTEILPVTVLFLVIILFNINLMTGALNGFIMYMQVFISLHVIPSRSTKIRGVTTLLHGINTIAYAFNLRFFNIPGLQFCLFAGAESLDIIIADYVVTLYSLCLVLVAVICLNCRGVNRCIKRMQVRDRTIHGISGFLVLCYARTTTTTLQILTPALLRGKGLRSQERVVFLQGDLKYLSHGHLKYAIPAIFVFVFTTCLPPLLLLVYPLCYKVLALVKLEESKFTRVLCKVIPLERFKPFFDSFQGDFKDNHRYFAGLYFVYRMLVLVLFALKIDIFYFFLSTEILLVLILLLHAWVRPYKKNWYNRLDLCIFALLIVINGITAHRFRETHHLTSGDSFILVLTTVQALLACTPLLYIIAYCFRRLLTACSSKRLSVKRFIKLLSRRKKVEDEDRSKLSLSMLDEGRGSVGYYKVTSC